MTPFSFHKPVDVAAARAAHAAGGGDSAYLAGGMTLLPTVKAGLRAPTDVIALDGLALSSVSVSADTIRIGAMTPHAEVAKALAGVEPALAKLAGGIGDPQVRNRGTIGGSLANNDPAADWPAGVLGYGARVLTDSRDIDADDFFKGMFVTDLEEGELITAIVFPRPQRAAYAKFRHPASRYALAGVCVVQSRSGDVRVAVTGVSAGVLRWSEAEAALSADFSPAAVANLQFSADDALSDIHADADYRCHLAGVMLRRALTA
jgi:aerobic carbon-monoxide dehydrogenase medium subunit